MTSNQSPSTRPSSSTIRFGIGWAPPSQIVHADRPSNSVPITLW